MKIKSLFNSWSRRLTGQHWIALTDAATVLAGGSPHTQKSRNADFLADVEHGHRLLVGAVGGGEIASVEREGTRYVRQADVRRWCETRGGTPWPVPHHPGEDIAGPADAAQSGDGPAAVMPILTAATPVPAPQQAGDDIDAPLDPRERTSLLVLVAGAAWAGKLDATAISRALSEHGIRVSTRTIQKHLSLVGDAIERRG